LLNRHGGTHENVRDHDTHGHQRHAGNIDRRGGAFDAAASRQRPAVVDPKGEVVGIITEGDLLRRAETGAATHHPRWLEFLLGPGRLAAEYTRAHARQVGEVMTRDIVSVHSETEVADLVQLMNKRRIKRVPVIDAGKPVGIVSRANLVRALVKALVKKPGGAVGDDKIWKSILDGIGAEPWGPRFSLDIAVKDGIVELYGTITDERERIALQVLAENIPGVKGVRDHLVWVEPVSGSVIAAEGE
jgi:CBS domain-containing protein